MLAARLATVERRVGERWDPCVSFFGRGSSSLRPAAGRSVAARQRHFVHCAPCVELVKFEVGCADLGSLAGIGSLSMLGKRSISGRLLGTVTAFLWSPVSFCAAVCRRKALLSVSLMVHGGNASGGRLVRFERRSPSEAHEVLAGAQERTRRGPSGERLPLLACGGSASSASSSSFPLCMPSTCKHHWHRMWQTSPQCICGTDGKLSGSGLPALAEKAPSSEQPKGRSCVASLASHLVLHPWGRVRASRDLRRCLTYHLARLARLISVRVACMGASPRCKVRRR